MDRPILKGFSTSRFFRIYNGLRGRCNNKNNVSHHKYGNRGIRCEWDYFYDFHNDMYEKYVEHCNLFGEKETTIDRIDNNGNYCKENCKWITWKEQSRNRRNTVYIEYKGKTKSLPVWADEIGIKRPELWRRIYDRGWSVERAFTQIPNYKK